MAGPNRSPIGFFSYIIEDNYKGYAFNLVLIKQATQLTGPCSKMHYLEKGNKQIEKLIEDLKKIRDLGKKVQNGNSPFTIHHFEAALTNPEILIEMQHDPAFSGRGVYKTVPEDMPEGMNNAILYSLFTNESNIRDKTIAVILASKNTERIQG